MTFPRYIALCGNPGAGKTEAQRVLQEQFGVVPIDDGHPMRQFAVEHLGLTWDQVRTKAGKKEFVTVAGKEWQVRDILGQLGNKIEDLFGPDGIPAMAIGQTAEKEGSFSFGSVRRDQGFFYRQHGGIVIEVLNPYARPSRFEFDQFNPEAVTHRLINDGLALGMPAAEARLDLSRKLWWLLRQIDKVAA